MGAGAEAGAEARARAEAEAEARAEARVKAGARAEAEAEAEAEARAEAKEARNGAAAAGAAAAGAAEGAAARLHEVELEKRVALLQDLERRRQARAVYAVYGMRCMGCGVHAVGVHAVGVRAVGVHAGCVCFGGVRAAVGLPVAHMAAHIWLQAGHIWLQAWYPYGYRRWARCACGCRRASRGRAASLLA